MKKNDIQALLPVYETHLRQEELKERTIQKYLSDIRRLQAFFPEETDIDKAAVIRYKAELKKRYRPASVNSYLIGLNQFFRWCGHPEWSVKTERIQKRSGLERALQQNEYHRLLAFARTEGKEKYYFLMKTLAGTGIRVGELAYITRETVEQRYVEIEHKGKIREICIPEGLAQALIGYCEAHQITGGPIFCGYEKGRPLDTTGIWKTLKRMAVQAGVDPDKVYPHSFRHLFAKTYMRQIGNLTELSDILGHSSIETTRIYTMETREEKRASLERLCL